MSCNKHQTVLTAQASKANSQFKTLMFSGLMKCNSELKRDKKIRTDISILLI